MFPDTSQQHTSGKISNIKQGHKERFSTLKEQNIFSEGCDDCVFADFLQLVVIIPKWIRSSAEAIKHLNGRKNSFMRKETFFGLAKCGY